MSANAAARMGATAGPAHPAALTPHGLSAWPSRLAGFHSFHVMRNRSSQGPEYSSGLGLVFDARWVGPHGIGRYASEISRRCQMQPLPLGGRAVDPWDPLRLYRCLSVAQPAHFFSPGFNVPLGRPCPFSLTLHDLIHLEVPEERTAAKTAYYQWVVRPATSKASVVFTGSEHARERLINGLGVPSERIVVAGHGVSEAFAPGGGVWPHERPYLLYVGNQKPHKNVPALIEAFAVSGLGKDFDLLLTGRFAPAVAQAMERFRIGERVQALGLVPEPELPALYRGARAVVMPSRYEGFGLPLIEAMACGTPVLSSNRTSLPEVGGDAVRYFDPDDRDAFVAGLRDIVSDTARADLVGRGLRRAQRFHWDRVASCVLTAIRATL